MSESKTKTEGAGHGNGSTQKGNRNSTEMPGFKAPTEGLKDIAFNTANTYQMAVDFRTNVKALVNHVGTTSTKVPHVALRAIHQIKVP